MGDMCTWWAPQASTLIDGFADKAVGGSIPSSSRHNNFTILSKI